jgi:hypothetical protein
MIHLKPGGAEMSVRWIRAVAPVYGEPDGAVAARSRAAHAGAAAR